MDYKLQFIGGTTNTDVFKRQIFSKIRGLTQFFEFDGKTLCCDIDEQDLKKLSHVVIKHNGEIKYL